MTDVALMAQESPIPSIIEVIRPISGDSKALTNSGRAVGEKAQDVVVGGPRFLRHPRGYGKLFDDAEANRATFIDKTSSASGSAKLRDCLLKDRSEAKDNCQIYGGSFHNTAIQGQTIVAGNPSVWDSILDCSEVSGSPEILDSRILDGTEICDMPRIKGGVTCRGAIIYSNPILWGRFEVTGRVHEGTWTRAPIHINLPWCSLSECVVKDGEQHVLLDCRCRSVSYWARHGAKLARRWDWSEDMISVTLDTIAREFKT